METNNEPANKLEQSIGTRRSTRRSLLPTVSQNKDTSKANKSNDHINDKIKDEKEILIEQTSKKSRKDQSNSKKTESNHEIKNEQLKNQIDSETSSSKKIESKPNASFKWKEGMLMEARDTAGKWYKSRIVDIDLDENKVLVHFLGWNSRYDQWFDANGDDLRFHDSNHPKEKKENEIKDEDDEANLEKIDVGTQVLAKWNDESFYPANVTRHLTKNGLFYYQVKFYDGIKKLIRFKHVKIMTEADAKFFNVEYKPKNDVKNDDIESIKSIEQNKEDQSLNDAERHAEAELLLAIQEPKIKTKDYEDEKGNSKIISEEKSENVDQKEQESTIDILDNKTATKKAVKVEDDKSKEKPIKEEINKSINESEATESDSVRKSLRAKKLRKFTKEFVFDSPASIIAYNLASVSDPSKLVPDTAITPLSQPNSKKRKHESSITTTIEGDSKSLDVSNLDDSVFEPSSDKDIQNSTSKKARDENTKLIQNYFKSLKIFKSNKKLTISSNNKTPVKEASNVCNEEKDENFKTTPLDSSMTENTERSKSGRIRISSKRKQEYEEEKAEEKKAREEKRRLKLESKKQKESKPKKEEIVSNKGVTSTDFKKLKKKMEKKKLKKDKKKLLKQLIESSQQQLRQQQELIEKQLKKHEHKKSQKKLQKILKQQQLQLQLQIQRQLQSQQQQIQTPNFNIFFPPTPSPSTTQQQLLNNFFFNKGFNTSQLLQKSKLIPQTVQASHTLSSTNSSTVSNGPLQCHFEDCKKTFRKQSLLEYHLKYHHYALQQTPASPSNQPPTRNKRTSRQDSNINEDSNDNYNHYDGDDPYEVIHCNCGNNVSEGFMIQCEICLCWQHGDCMNIKSTKQAPKNYLCWICRVPTNKLKQLKYQNWMSELKNKDLCISEANFKLDNNTKGNIDTSKLKLLNECSKKYYNLNLLMYTLEYQMSLLNQITQENESSSLFNQDIEEISADSVMDEETVDQVEKLLLNISHLQNCLNKKFEDFNSKIDEFESKYKCDDDNLISRNFNLEELYSQLQTLINRDEASL